MEVRGMFGVLLVSLLAAGAASGEDGGLAADLKLVRGASRRPR